MKKRAFKKMPFPGRSGDVESWSKFVSQTTSQARAYVINKQLLFGGLL
jgi:hypothetical protein